MKTDLGFMRKDLVNEGEGCWLTALYCTLGRLLKLGSKLNPELSSLDESSLGFRALALGYI